MAAKTKMKHPVLCVLCVGLMLISLYIAFNGMKVTRELTRKPVSFNELTPQDSVSGQIAAGQVYASVGTYGQTYKQDSEGNILQDETQNFYFLVAADNNYCISLCTDEPEMISKLMALSEATDKFSANETDTIEAESFQYMGMLTPMTQDELTHMYSWIIENGVFGAETVEEASEYIIPYKMVSYDKSVGMPTLIGGCAGFVIFAVLILVLIRQREEDDDD